jgi:SynChlorMet cassette radical SAM/SPASM protein ScmF
LSQTEIPQLRTLYFYITNTCNLRCTHCWLARQTGQDRSSELTTFEIKDVIDQALPLGLKSIKLTGGEPFVRDDIVEIVGFADELGVTVRLETNAMLLNGGTARALAGFHRLRQVAVSLDGATPESHGLLRGADGAFDKTVRGIKHLVESGLRVQVISCLHRGNVGEMAELIALAAGLGASSFKINPITSLGRGQEMAEQGSLLDLEEVLEFNRWLEDGSAGGGGISTIMSLPLVFQSLAAIRRQGMPRCGVMNLLGVLPGGELSLCGIGEAHPDLVFGHVRRESLRAVWEGSAVLARVRQEIGEWPAGLCRRCMVKRYCTWGYCRAEAHALSGSLSAPSPACQAAWEAGLFPAGRLLPG